MPHVVVKMHAGRSDAERRSMADAVAAALHETMGYKQENVSVAVEEVAPDAWMTTVYEPEIVGRLDQVVRRPGYGPLAE